MDPAFEWPADIAIAADGRPVMPLTGLKKTTAFALS
jgi:hypothetical protein